VITSARLVVNDGDKAGRAGTERILSCSISNTTGRQRRDGGRCSVRAADNLLRLESAVSKLDVGGQ
jgi:hypothetical protein